MIILPEATDNKISFGHRGALWLRVEAHGVAAHGSLPELGKHAILTLSEDVIAKIQDVPKRQDDYLGGESVNLGMISGGNAPNIVADHAWLTLDFRTVAESGTLLKWISSLNEEPQ